MNIEDRRDFGDAQDFRYNYNDRRKLYTYLYVCSYVQKILITIWLFGKKLRIKIRLSTYFIFPIRDTALESANKRILKPIKNMLYPFYENLLSQQKEELNQIANEKHDAVEALGASLNCIRSYLQILKDKLVQEPFEDENAEIHFFKKVKPEFYALKIFHVEKFNLERSYPASSKETQSQYLEAELKYVERFFASHAFYYQYFKFNMEELDKQYFLRRMNQSTMLTFEVPDSSPDFSTGFDYLFAKFIALERLKRLICDKINLLHHTALPPQACLEEVPVLKWTGESINLVEIAYGIWLTGQVNNGNASISEIVRWMEKGFQVHIGGAHRRWVEIARRKRTSYTKYLNKMGELISERVENELAR